MRKKSHTEGDGKIEDEASTEHLLQGSVILVILVLIPSVARARKAGSLPAREEGFRARGETYTSDGLDGHCDGVL